MTACRAVRSSPGSRRDAEPIRAYAWGSRTGDRRAQGRAGAQPGPEAELWLGAHPDAPSTVDRRRRRRRWPSCSPPIRSAGSGRPVVDRFGPGCRTCSRCSRPTRHCRCRPTRTPSRPGPGSPRAGSRDGAGSAQLRRPVPQARAAGGADADSTRCAASGTRLVAAELLRRLGLPALAPVVAALRSGPAGAAPAPCERCSPGRRGRAHGAGRAAVAAELAGVAELAGRPGRALPGRPGRAGGVAAQPGRLAPGRGDLDAGRQPARLSARCGRRDHGGQRQRAARRPDAEAGRRAGAAARAALRGAARSCAAGGRMPWPCRCDSRCSWPAADRRTFALRPAACRWRRARRRSRSPRRDRGCCSAIAAAPPPVDDGPFETVTLMLTGDGAASSGRYGRPERALTNRGDAGEACRRTSATATPCAVGEPPGLTRRVRWEVCAAAVRQEHS